MLISICLYTLIYKPALKVSELFNAAVTQERPPASYLFCAIQIDVNDLQTFFVYGGTEKEFTLWPGHETAAPELYAVCLPAWVRFMSCTVYGNDWKSVCYRMSSLYCCPCLSLSCLLVVCVT